MNKIPDILEKIVTHKRLEISQDLEKTTFDEMQQKAKSDIITRDFISALTKKTTNKQNAVIAEIKKASPSKGVFREDFHVANIAKSYQDGGASCLSVLTDVSFFQGHNDFVNQAKNATNLPVLRKDFIIDEYQIYQARTIGADCILLIVAILTDEQLTQFNTLAQSLNMAVLVEVHDLQELKRALKLNLKMVGINNRNLRDFSVSLSTTFELLKEVPKETIIITESGILNKEDITIMNEHQIFGFLIGEAFMRADNPGKLLKEII
jgi:indole-3-glycerol phosphate synthase